MTEQESFEQELLDIGVEVVKREDIKENMFLSVQVDLDTEVDYSHLIGDRLTLKKLTKRKDFFYISFDSYSTSHNKLTISVNTPVTPDVFKYYSSLVSSQSNIIGTNFPDLCWYFAEGTTELTRDEVDTKFRESCVIGDLTWYLPARMVDNFIEIMHTLNQTLLEGLMQHTICYGPFLEENLDR